ncbi:MAG: ribonuclease P protein component [Candidatus Brocadiia bacterium]
MKRFGFPKAARIVRSRDFARVQRRGRRLNVFPLRVRALPRGEGRSRLGLGVGRKVGKAVVRNRWKRAIREAFRRNRHRLDRPYDLVISVAWEAEPNDIEHVPEAFLQVIDELKADDERTADTAALD